MKRSLVIIALVLGACDATAVTTTTTTTTTVLDNTTTTAGQQLVDGGLVPADPPTLIPLAGEEPIVIGRAHSGVVSSNRLWAGVVTQIEAGLEEMRVSIIDLSANEVVASADIGTTHIVVMDTGRLFFFRDGQLVTLGADGVLAAVDSPAVPTFLEGTLTDLGDGRIGFLSAAETERSNVTVVIADSSGVIDTHEVPRVAGPISSDDGLPHRSHIVPAVAWTASTAYVVSAEADQFTSVDLDGGTTSDGTFVSPGELTSEPVRRSVWTNGDSLLIASSYLSIEGDGTSWTASETPGRMVVVDLEDGSSLTQEVDVDTLIPSGDGTTLTAMGTTVESDSEGVVSTTQSPVFLIDIEEGRPLVGFEGNSGTIADVQYSPNSNEIYVVSTSDLGTNIDVIDVASRVLAGNVAFTRISLVGEAGLMAFHSTAD